MVCWVKCHVKTSDTPWTGTAHLPVRQISDRICLGRALASKKKEARDPKNPTLGWPHYRQETRATLTRATRATRAPGSLPRAL